MDLKSVVILILLSLSAPAGKVTDSPYETGQRQLSVDATASDSCNCTLWIILFGVSCAVGVTVVGVVICCFCSGKCNKRGKPEDQERIPVLRNEIFQNQIEQLKAEIEFAEARIHRVDVILDPSTAHPRLEVSQDGKCVRDTGSVLRVPNSEERFDSHLFVLAKDGFVKGRHYWEVEVGLKKSWDLGVASESISKKGMITLAPQYGYWVIGLDGKKGYWARTEPWTRLDVSGKPNKIGIFLNLPERNLSFFDVNRKSKLHTYTVSSSEKKLYPFFSVSSETDSFPLKIPLWHEEDNIDEHEESE